MGLIRRDKKSLVQILEQFKAGQTTEAEVVALVENLNIKSRPIYTVDEQILGMLVPHGMPAVTILTTLDSDYAATKERELQAKYPSKVFITRMWPNREEPNTPKLSVITDDHIKELALDNGFKVKNQSDGSTDLNPYVYEFARALITKAHQQFKVVGFTNDEQINALDGSKPAQLYPAGNILHGIPVYLSPDFETDSKAHQARFDSFTSNTAQNLERLHKILDKDDKHD